MTTLSNLSLAVMALGLSACVSTASLDLADDHPANPTAAAGLISTPAALEGYKSSDDFAARAAADANTPPSSHAGHGGMQNMQHGGGHAGMPHGEASQGATSR